MTDILKRQGIPVSPILPKNRFKFWPSIFLAASILFFLPASNAYPAQVTLAWDAGTDPNIAGYKVHYGTSSGSYQTVIDVGNITTCTISNLLDGITYYFAATDYNTPGIESGNSNEVSYTTSAACTYSISPTSQSPDSSDGSGTVSVTASSGCTWTAVSNASWITITSNSSVTGNGTVYYSVSANSGTTSRTGTLTIAGKTFTVTQSVSSQYSLGINKTGTGTGTVTNNPGGTTFNPGTVVPLTATPNAGSTFTGWSGGCSGISPTCSVTMNSNTSVTATFALQSSYIITANAETGGSISPSGTVPVNYGASQSFTVTSDWGYRIADVQVDGVSVGRTSTYLFGNVAADHTINASFQRWWGWWWWNH